MVSLDDYKPGIRLAVDFGQVRVGVAKCDSNMVLASAVTTIRVDESLFPNLLNIIREVVPDVIYVGLPLNLQGSETPSTEKARAFATELMMQFAHESSNIQIRLLDERLTTVTAQSNLRNQGISQKQSREFIDQLAAVTLLEFAMESEKRQQSYAGQLVQFEN